MQRPIDAINEQDLVVAAAQFLVQDLFGIDETTIDAVATVPIDAGTTATENVLVVHGGWISLPLVLLSQGTRQGLCLAVNLAEPFSMQYSLDYSDLRPNAMRHQRIRLDGVPLFGQRKPLEAQFLQVARKQRADATSQFPKRSRGNVSEDRSSVGLSRVLSYRLGRRKDYEQK